MALSQDYRTLVDKDRRTAELCSSLSSDVLEPDERINIARKLLAIQEDRKTVVELILDKEFNK